MKSKSLTAVPVLASGNPEKGLQARESTDDNRERKLAAPVTSDRSLSPSVKDSRGGSQKPSRTKGGDASCPTHRSSSTNMEATLLGSSAAPTVQSAGAARTPQFQAFLDSLEPQPWKRKKLAANWATCHFNPVPK